MSSSKRKGLKNLFTNNVDCGCGKPKLTDIFEPKPKTKTFNNKNSTRHHSSSSSWERGGGHSIENEEEDYTSTTFSLNNIDTSPHFSEHANDPTSSQMAGPHRKLSDSIAVVKDSDDPYHDFRNSMHQMILEKKIYSKDELQELLHCFLKLNSPSYHEVIVQAFMEIWNGVSSTGPVPKKPCAPKMSHET